MIRLFVALKIPQEIKEKLKTICNTLSANLDDYKWESEDKIHLTLKFIGEVADNLVPPISNELKFIKEYPQLDCSITKFGFLYRDGNPKILWSELKIDDIIFKLVKELNVKMQKFDVELERRKFRPHLTLLRIRKPLDESVIEKFNNYKFEEMRFTADKIALVKSELFREGAKYIDLKLYELN